MRYSKAFGWSLICLALTESTALAQVPNAIQQVESAQRRSAMTAPAGRTNAAPEFYEGETSDIGPQSVLQFKRHRKWFEASADAQYFYTDNLFLADHNQQSADVLISTVMFALAPSPFEFGGGQLSPRLGYQHQWFNFGLASPNKVKVYDANGANSSLANLDLFDFSVSTVFADASWQVKDWNFTLGMDFRRLLDSGDYDEFYREYVPRWAVRRDFNICDSLGLSIAYEGDYRFTETALPPPHTPADYNDRTDHSLVLSGSWQICRHAILQPFYRLQYTHYTQVDRDDLLHSFGLAVYCPITKLITLRAFVGYDILSSDGSAQAQDCDKLDAGGGLNLTIRF